MSDDEHVYTSPGWFKKGDDPRRGPTFQPGPDPRRHKLTDEDRERSREVMRSRNPRAILRAKLEADAERQADLWLNDAAKDWRARAEAYNQALGMATQPVSGPDGETLFQDRSASLNDVVAVLAAVGALDAYIGGAAPERGLPAAAPILAEPSEGQR